MTVLLPLLIYIHRKRPQLFGKSFAMATAHGAAPPREAGVPAGPPLERRARQQVVAGGRTRRHAEPARRRARACPARGPARHRRASDRALVHVPVGGVARPRALAALICRYRPWRGADRSARRRRRRQGAQRRVVQDEDAQEDARSQVRRELHARRRDRGRGARGGVAARAAVRL